MTAYNDEIWVTENDEGTWSVATGKSASSAAEKVSGSPSTIKDMAVRISKRNNGSLTFPTRDAAEGALQAEKLARLAGI